MYIFLKHIAYSRFRENVFCFSCWEPLYSFLWHRSIILLKPCTWDITLSPSQPVPRSPTAPGLGTGNAFCVFQRHQDTGALGVLTKQSSEIMVHT